MPTIDGSDVAECASTLITELDQGIGAQERNIDLKALLGDIDEQNSQQMGDGKEEILEYGDEVLVEEKMDVQGLVSSEDEAEKDEEGEHDNDSIANPRDGDDGGTVESKGDPKEKTEDVVSRLILEMKVKVALQRRKETKKRWKQQRRLLRGTTTRRGNALSALTLALSCSHTS